jgi:hypothetical protein
MCSRPNNCSPSVSLMFARRLISERHDIRDIQKPILVLVFLIDAAHQRSSRRQNLIDEDENRLFRREFDALADHINKLTDSQVRGDKIFLLVDGCDVGFLDFLADHLGKTAQVSGRDIISRREHVQRGPRKWVEADSQ